MSITIREMDAGEAGIVVAMVKDLARDIGAMTVPRLTASELTESRDLMEVMVADDGDRLVGACLTLMTFSTWRGSRGVYVADLFVEAAARGQDIGQRLLRNAAARGVDRGAKFIKLEVDLSNPAAERFYQRLGFKRKDEDRLFFLEQDRLAEFIA